MGNESLVMANDSDASSGGQEKKKRDVIFCGLEN